MDICSTPTLCFRVFSVIVFGAMAIGQASAFAPDAAKASVSAQKICMLLDKVPAIDSESTDGKKPTSVSYQTNRTLHGTLLMYTVSYSIFTCFSLLF